MSKHTSSFGLVLGGKLNLKGDKKRKKTDGRPRRTGADADADAEAQAEAEAEAAMLAYSADPVLGTGQMTSSGVVVMGHDTDFTQELSVGDTLLLSVIDRYRDTETNESRRINMLLGKSSLNVEAPFSCDLTSPSNFMFVKKAPDLDAIRAVRADERKRAKFLEEDSKEVTYKVIKPGSGPWQAWKTVTEKVDGGSFNREDMLKRRVEMKADRHCK